MILYRVFFFQAEDGIRDIGVTGVQTCALPILNKHHDELNKLKVYNHQLNEKIKERKNNLQVSSNLNLKQMNEAIDTIKEQLKNGIFVDYTTYSEIINNLSHAISEGVIEKSIYDKLISMVSNK